MAGSSMTSSRQFIERVRRTFLFDDDLPDHLRDGALNLQTQLNNALKLLSEDLYSKKSHFILELVQNADDNSYRDGVTPELSIQISPSRLVFANNELGFTEENISAICKVGASSKAKDKQIHIGEKGIGFKSVFSVSNAPEIHSNGYHFRFDRTDSKNLLGYVIPTWCEPAREARRGYTTIVLPAAPGYVFNDSTVTELDARVLLFLNKLRQLTLAFPDSQRVYRRQDEADFCCLTTEIAPLSADTGIGEFRYLRVSKSYAMSGPYEDQKRPDLSESNLVLSFPVDNYGAAKPEAASHVFAYLPVQQVGFYFPLHADFILSSGRETILNDRPWNQRLRDAIAETFVSALAEFRKTEALGLSYLRFVPSESDVVDDFFIEVRPQIIKGLSAEDSLPSATGTWRKPGDLRIADKGFRALFTSAQALSLFGFEYIDSRVQGERSLLRELGVREAGRAEVLALFNVHGQWVATQPLEWRASLYAYIAADTANFLKAGLLKVPCLPTSSGSYVIPAQTQVFFPLGKKKKYGFESELTIVDNELFDAAQELSPQVEELFEQMNVRRDDPYDLVVGHILPRHEGESWKTSAFEGLVGHLRYIKEKLEVFLEQAGSHGKSAEDAFELLRDGIWVGTKLVNEHGNWTFRRVGALYLGKEYKPGFCIETLTEGGLDPSLYVSADYLAKKPKDPDSDAKSWREFFTRLGIRTSPALEPMGNDWKCSKELNLLMSSAKPSTRKATLECLNLHWGQYSSRLTYTVQSSRSRYNTTLETTFLREIRSMSAPLKGKRESAPLSECYYLTEEIRATLGDTAPYVDAFLVINSMLDACKVTYRLDAKTLIKRLNQLKQSQSGTAKQVQSIYRALEGRPWESDDAYIRHALENDGLIRLTGTHRGWFSQSEVAWQSNGPFLDSLYPPIQATYKDFQGFFVDKLKVSRNLPLSKCVEALAHLDKIPNQFSREEEALAIYKRAERALKPQFGREVKLPDWIDTFKYEAVFVDNRGDLVTRDDGLYANDSPWLADLFKDEEGLSFLAISSDEIPRLNRLMTASGVSRLSEAVSIQVEAIEGGELDAELTSRLQRSVPHFARILYSRVPSAFESAMEAGKLTALWELQVMEVPVVNLQVELGEFERQATTDAAMADGHIYYRANVRSLKDRVANELSKYLAGTNDLADTFVRILMEEDDEGIEEFLRVRSIGQLPSDLSKRIHPQQLPTTEGHDGAEGELLRRDSSADEQAADLQSGVDDDGSPQPAHQPEVQPEVGGLALSLERTRPNDAAQADETAAVPRSSATSFEAGRVPQEHPTTPAVRSVPPSSPAPTSGQDAAASSAGGATHPTSPKQSGRRPALPPTTQLPSGGYATSTFPLTTRGDNGPPSAEASAAKGISQGNSAPKISQVRTRSGRLLSYAERPSDIGRASPENDPTSAEARDATGKAAVAHALKSLAGRWASMTEMPHNNPGFDILARTFEDVDEYIEVKGQTGAWTQEGVALTPTELSKAREQDGHYWLCVVEFAQDDKRRQIHLIRNPFSLVSQFRFDVGWKGVAQTITSAPTVPEKGMYIDIADEGAGRIISVKKRGAFYRVHVILKTERQVYTPFNPAKMSLSLEPLWQE